VACDAHIFDAVIYNRALSPSEIALLTDRTDPMLGGLVVEERPVLYFDMGGSTTDELTASNLTVSAPVLGTPTLGAPALNGSDIVIITAAEATRIVRATPRMKTVTASARVKQVRYEVARA